MLKKSSSTLIKIANFYFYLSYFESYANNRWLKTCILRQMLRDYEIITIVEIEHSNNLVQNSLTFSDKVTYTIEILFVAYL